MVDAAYLRSLSESSADDTDTNVKYYGSLTIVGYVYTTIAFLVSITFAIWTHRNSSTNVVKASQPIFLLLICIGIFIASSSIIAMTFDDGHTTTRGADIACMCVPWLNYPGLVLVYAAMFSKTWRAYKIINNAQRFQRVTVTATDVMIPLHLLMTSIFIILICWTILSPVQFKREDNGYGKCQSDQIAFRITATVLFNITFIITAYMAWRARNISAEFSESRYIFIIMGTSIVISAIRTVLALGKTNNESFLADATAVFLNSLIILLLIFVPKVITLRRRRRKRDREGETTPKERNVDTPARREQTIGDEPPNVVGTAPPDDDKMKDTVLAPTIAERAPAVGTAPEMGVSASGHGEEHALRELETIEKEEKVNFVSSNEKQSSVRSSKEVENGMNPPPD